MAACEKVSRVLQAALEQSSSASQDALKAAADSLASSLGEGSTSPEKLATLQAAADTLLRDSDQATALLDALLWEVFPLALGCLTCGGDGVRDAALRLLSGIAAKANAREVHLLAMAHLSAYEDPSVISTVVEAAAVSLRRLPAAKRRNFLESSLPAVAGCMMRLARAGKSSKSDGVGGQMNGSDDGSASSTDAVGDEGEDIESVTPADSEAAAAAAAVAAAFALPLLDASFVAKDPQDVVAAAADPAIAAPLSSLLLESTQIALAAGTRPASSHIGSSDSCSFTSQNCAVEALELVVRVPGVHLEVVLEHHCRRAYEAWRQRGQKRRRRQHVPAHGDDTDLEAGSAFGSKLLPSSLGSLTLLPPLPWQDGAVAAAAYVSVCDAEGARRCMPKVWSARFLWQLYWPHARTLLQSRSSAVAAHGIDLLAECALPLQPPPPPGAPRNAFPVRVIEQSEAGTPGGSNSGGGGGEVDAAAGAKAPPGRSSKGAAPEMFDPWACDVSGLLQLLVNAVVACPDAAVRSRGHAALEAVAAAVEPEARFTILETLVVHCPFPNFGGLLVDCFRKHVRAAMAARAAASPVPSQEAAAAACVPAVAESKGARGSTSNDDNSAYESADPFASPRVGKFLTERLKAMAASPLRDLLSLLDVHLAVLNLLRFCLLVPGGGGGGGDDTSMGTLGLSSATVRAEQAAALRSFRAQVRRRIAECDSLAEIAKNSDQESGGDASLTKEYPFGMGKTAALAGGGEASILSMDVEEVASRRPQDAKKPPPPPPEHFRLSMAEEAADSVLRMLPTGN